MPESALREGWGGNMPEWQFPKGGGQYAGIRGGQYPGKGVNMDRSIHLNFR